MGFAETIQKHINDGSKLDKRKAEALALQYGITDKTIVKESIELAIVLTAREIANGSGSVREKFTRIVNLYHNQVNLSHRTSQSIMLQQYSTPAPIAYLAGAYVSHNLPPDYRVFEPSAGNGLLTIAFKPERVTVNEIDQTRHQNLTIQPFYRVLRRDATEPFTELQKHFDGIVTNPPFGTLDRPIQVDEFKINHLDHVMAIRALDCMRDNGRAAIIIGGHTHYDAKGRVQAGKNRIFLTYLYSHYNVDDIINIDGSLYSRQGTSFDVRLILISGRKAKPEGFPPLKNDDATPITDFESLYERVMGHWGKVNKLSIAKAKANALLLIQMQNTMGSISDFGEVFTQFKGKPKEAIKHLMKVRQGEAIAALHRDDIGDIDIVWGENDPKTNKGFGLKHIIEKHGKEIEQLGFKVEDFIPIVVQFGEFNKKESQNNRLAFESKMFRFVVEQYYMGKKKQWLLTAFDLRKKPKI